MAVYPFSQGGSPATSITGTPNLASGAALTGYDGGQGLAPAIQTIWSN